MAMADQSYVELPLQGKGMNKVPTCLCCFRFASTTCCFGYGYSQAAAQLGLGERESGVRSHDCRYTTAMHSSTHAQKPQDNVLYYVGKALGGYSLCLRNVCQ